MNYSIIIYIIGMILKIEAVFMALPAITALIYQETSGVAFLITIALCLVIGLPLTRKSRQERLSTQRRFRDCSIKLDRSEYHRSNPLCDQPKHSKSCRCII